jgi:hypothetical protein
MEVKKVAESSELDFILEKWIDCVFDGHLNSNGVFVEDDISTELKKVEELRNRKCQECGSELEDTERKCKDCNKFYTIKKEKGYACFEGTKRSAKVIEVFESEKKVNKKPKIEKKENQPNKSETRNKLIEHYKTGSPLEVEENHLKECFDRADTDKRYNHINHKHPTIPHILLPADPCMVNPNSRR